MPSIFITGGTGYIGKRLIKKLVARRYDVTAVVRKGSENKLPKGVRAIIANPFDASTFLEWIPKNSIYIQLLGVSHPSPKKKRQFYEIDVKSAKVSADAALQTSASHFIYVSVAMAPSTIMKDYQQARKEAEDYLKTKDLNCTIIRPWYVLGPGHWWPILLLPFYGIAELVPTWREKARHKALVTIGQMVKTILHAVESTPQRLRIVEISQIRKLS